MNIIDQSKQSFSDVEFYVDETSTTKVTYGNGELKSIASKSLGGACLRVVKDGKAGVAVGTYPGNAEDLVAKASSSAERGDTQEFTFASPSAAPAAAFAPETPSQTAIDLCEEAREAILAELPDLSLSIDFERNDQRVSLETFGGQAEFRRTTTEFGFAAPIKGAGTQVWTFGLYDGTPTLDRQMVADFVRTYRWTETTRTPKTGKMPIIWTPDALFIFALCLGQGLSGEEVLKGTSPLVGKIGEKLFDSKLTIWDDPVTPRPNARPFDDEGTPTQKRAVVNRGVVDGYLTDLRTAKALGVEPTGNGYKDMLFRAGINIMPVPGWGGTMCIEPGTASLDELIKGTGDGILLTGGMGFHSANFKQGDVAVQAVGFLIEGGEVTGRLEKTMLSGNIYEDFRNIRAIGAEQKPGWWGWYAPVLVDSMQVVGA